MPELPDLTVYAENLAKALTGKRVHKAAYHQRGKLNVAETELCDAVAGAELTGVERAGKQVAFRFGNGNIVRVHLMLTGGFVLTDAGRLDRLRYPVLTVTFDDGSVLGVADEKGWASVALNPGEEKDAPDALAVTAEQLEQLCRKKPKTLIKALLLDQAQIGGIGNAYADEILWTARISPKSPAGKLPPEAVRALADAIPQVLEDAIAELRKRHPDMVSGEYREFLKVHRPELKSSPTGARIIKENVQSKRTYYTEEQQLFQ
ncbi:Fpg/Nei family DNA glycosylase [Geomonas subterranea]|uniref:Formamidopyrimidine-DNA glycosylase n=1 Tax=Geomonas subterranea TaxID=2847989 RepID=A0ABX8LG21_9BACT|nr:MULTISPECIES: DNA-formamidopyrimidine glycosylase family protein [Geomonas]QXE90658.1 formamidopyrimidine-DNA glycosylase [Geomonas subterranea]QXM11262.1 formamidopyrimidine-DNA glycosylase [Geomonas subterranea]